MSIVLNECEWAERAIKDKTLGKKPYETLSRVAKYLICLSAVFIIAFYPYTIIALMSIPTSTQI